MKTIESGALCVYTYSLYPRPLVRTCEVYFAFAFALTAAQRLRCASAMAFLALADNTRRFLAGFAVAFDAPMLDSKARAFWRRAISESISAMIEVIDILIFLSEKSYRTLHHSALEPIGPWYSAHKWRKVTFRLGVNFHPQTST